ncbi:Golgi apyrase [Vanrija albida]|uniref:Golgi apyrase n=1 Tax=Vanrija albida TaxID=181172 RepID=A0ABR3PYN4_9TREE
MAPSVSSKTTHYALVIDAGSSGSRMQIYSWRDPGLERDEIVAEVKEARAAGAGKGSGPETSKWWWWDSIKGKGKASSADMERRALRRLVRVGKGVEGEAWVKRVEPGISSFAVAPEDIPGYLQPLMQHALDHIPPSQLESTPIFVLATAGMRLLNPEAQNAILQVTCDTLRKSYPFKLHEASAAGPCGDSVRIISGEEEGIWGWVAVNYLMDGFGHAPELAHAQGVEGHDHLLPLAPLASAPPGSKDSVTPVDISHHSPTFGFLDMGGASTQLAFSPSIEELEHSRFPKSDLATVSLRLLSGELVEWPVFAASWLGFGTNQVRERYVEAAVEQWKADAKANGADPARDDPIADPCLPTGLILPSPDPTKHPDFIGTGSFGECLTSLKPLLSHDKPCPAKHCLFGGLATPHIDFHRSDQRGFIGISEYWYTAQQVLGLGGVWDWAEWERGMSAFCAQDWDELEAKGKNGQIEINRLRLQCFKGAWISNVLHEGIGIPRLGDKGGNDTLTGGDVGDTNAEAERRAKEKGLFNKGKPKPHFQSMDEVGETAISWTLGKVVIEASRSVNGLQPHGGLHPLHKLQATVADLGPAVWAYVVVAGILLTLAFSAVRRRTRNTYRGRKSSSAGLNGRPLTNGWIPWSSGTPTPEAYALEEGNLGALGFEGKPRVPSGAGRLRLWSRRLTQMLRRNASFGGHDTPRKPTRHVSMPVGTYSPGWGSQPPSPREASGSSSAFFTPGLARSSLASASTRSLSGLEHAPASAGSATPTSPPLRGGRSKSGPGRPRPVRSTSNGLLEPHSGAGGWNDPPMALFTPAPSNPYESASSGDENALPKPSSGVLTPTAGPGGEHALSRNSSRVNLTELGHGLAQRTANRANTPQKDGP